MLIRESSQGYNLRIYKNTSPGATRIKNYPDGKSETITYPSDYAYFLVLDGKIIQKSNSWATIEQSYVDECENRHGGGKGRMKIGKHKLVNHKIVNL
tara:strand:- start:294 stop:584 length:291 start_codon:yes stop_codon:yes gene_type:complete